MAAICCLSELVQNSSLSVELLVLCGRQGALMWAMIGVTL